VAQFVRRHHTGLYADNRLVIKIQAGLILGRSRSRNSSLLISWNSAHGFSRIVLRAMWQERALLTSIRFWPKSRFYCFILQSMHRLNFFYCGIRDELLALGSCFKTEKHLTMRINMARFLPPGALESSGATGQRALGDTAKHSLVRAETGTRRAGWAEAVELQAIAADLVAHLLGDLLHRRPQPIQPDVVDSAPVHTTCG
jgi:hypothetical protein